MDMAVEISERALEVVRAQIEAAAAAAKEAASHSLLRELEEEAAQQALAKKVERTSLCSPCLIGLHVAWPYCGPQGADRR